MDLSSSRVPPQTLSLLLSSFSFYFMTFVFVCVILCVTEVIQIKEQFEKTEYFWRFHFFKNMAAYDWCTVLRCRVWNKCPLSAYLKTLQVLLWLSPVAMRRARGTVDLATHKMGEWNVPCSVYPSGTGRAHSWNTAGGWWWNKSTVHSTKNDSEIIWPRTGSKLSAYAPQLWPSHVFM